MSKKVVIAFVAVVIAVFVPAVVSPAFVRARATTATDTCVNNLRQIDAAKNQWMFDKNKTTNDVPTWDDLRPYMEGSLCENSR